MYPPKFTVSSVVVTVKDGVEMKKQTKTKIGVKSVVKAKVRDLEKATREGRSSRMMKEVVGCANGVLGKKKFFFLFKYGHKKEKRSSLLVHLISKEEVEMEEPISHLPEK